VTTTSQGVETVIVPRAHDLGGFEVRRALPSQARQMVGPFIFFDQMGPGEFLTDRGGFGAPRRGARDGASTCLLIR
jgi:redox-sensitive bicupin YhaK (pirin superfamily)